MDTTPSETYVDAVVALAAPVASIAVHLAAAWSAGLHDPYGRTPDELLTDLLDVILSPLRDAVPAVHLETAADVLSRSVELIHDEVRLVDLDALVAALAEEDDDDRG